MLTLPVTRSFGRLLLTVVVVVAELQLAGLAYAAQRQTPVLVLYSARRDAQIVVLAERELPRILEDGLPGGVDYYSEYIDRARFPEAQYQVAFREFLRLKYAEHEFDVIIAMSDLALDFVKTNRQELFPNVPVVFLARSAATRPIPNSTGVTAQAELRGSLGLATGLQPEIKSVFFVNGAGNADKEFEMLARAQFKSLEPGLAFTYLIGLETSDLESRLANLPERSIIYYGIVNTDGAGHNFHPLEYLDRIAAVANRPIYSWVDSVMGHGVVGGKLRNQRAEIDAVAALALRVLRGERPDSIPPASPDLTSSEVDWRQLRRWGISERRVPEGTAIQFRELSVWDRYRLYIIIAVGLMLAQMSLIAGLLVQRARRRQAENDARASQAELRTSYDRIRDLATRLLGAQESERARIARELHDDISQQMALLEIDLEMLTGTVDGGAEDLAGGVLNRAQSIAKSVHDLSHRLHPAKLRLLGLVAALRGFERELSRSDLAVSFTHRNVPPVLPEDLTLCLFRVAQEALQNAIKYARAKKVAVNLEGSPDGLALTVADDGVGFDVDAAWGKGLGLVSMRERLDAVGGTLDIRSTPGGGTQLQISVPLPVIEDSEGVAAV